MWNWKKYFDNLLPRYEQKRVFRIVSDGYILASISVSNQILWEKGKEFLFFIFQKKKSFAVLIKWRGILAISWKFKGVDLISCVENKFMGYLNNESKFLWCL